MFRLSTFAVLIGTTILCRPATAQEFTQTNLVSDGAVPAAVTDPNLVNPWGVSAAPGGAFWVSDTGTGLTTLYNTSGAIQPLVVAIPSPAGDAGPSLPTGQVFNPTQGFQVTKGGKTGAPAFIFDTISGTISGWSPAVDPANAVIAVDHSAQHAVYLGLALYSTPAASYLLAANFASGLVEVYNSDYQMIYRFRDQGGVGVRSIPANYSPYNVAVVNGHIFVSYAVPNPATGTEKLGLGLGFVDEVTLQGKLVRRVASHGVLNAPWGMSAAPASFGRFAKALLVGNFGDGRISAYRIADGKFLGQLITSKQTYFAEPGLWAILPGNGGAGGDASSLYFTAGIKHEAHGLLGSLTPAK
jgi:uncharacterized protein (TIGR03118 family)